MKFIDAYRMAVEMGAAKDPRDREDVEAILKKATEELEKADDMKKEVFDQERLWNPYGDSRISIGDPDQEIEAVLWGIDMGTGEALLADRLNQKGAKIGALIGHHPIGLSKNPFPDVMYMQEDMYHAMGVPINVAEGLMSKRIEEVFRAVMASNFNQTVDACRLLGLSLANLHSPCDNMVQDYLETLFQDKEAKRLEDIIEILMTVPEYRKAAAFNSPPTIIVGKKSSRAGKIVFKMTGGTSGPKEIYEKMADAGVGTAVGMHFPESHIEEARKNNINLVIAGHMSSDSLGINLIADAWEKEGIEIVPCSGFIRVSRN
ncbi:MAG: hypothetical protein PHW93_03765 [Candidatus Methanomethylophilaceae archaeon]|nr:hypothetical protein [Candidatus Methanomethylophilaceae archaeon]